MESIFEEEKRVNRELSTPPERRHNSWSVPECSYGEAAWGWSGTGVAVGTFSFLELCASSSANSIRHMSCRFLFCF